MFNRTKRNLYSVIKEIPKYFSHLLVFANDYIRMTIHACKFARAYLSKCFKDIASYVYCALKKETYFRLKLHALVGVYGLFLAFS